MKMRLWSSGHVSSEIMMPLRPHACHTDADVIDAAIL